jgi:hypothetical protein
MELGSVMLKAKVFSAIQGSLNNLLSSDVPNFARATPTWIESYVEDSLKIEPVEAHQPAVHPEDSAIILEPAGINLITHNLNLSDSSWIKGSNVRVYPDEVESPDTTTYQGDRIDWGNGEGATQLITRKIPLRAGKTYTLTAFLRLPPGEQASEKDVMRCGGSVFPLKRLNEFINRYRICEFQVKTGGSQLTLPAYSHSTSYAVTAVTSTTVTLAIADGVVAANQFAGGQVQFGTETRLYLILSNTASGANGATTLTLETTTLISDGVTNSSAARLHSAPDSSVDLEFYCESSLSLHFGGIQLEERPFRTSMIYQDEALNVRGATLLSYRRNPIAKLKSFGIFVAIKDWKGDGNLIDLGNIKASITNSRLVVVVSGVTISAPDPLPARSKVYIQVSAENTNICLYINKVLVSKSNIYDFVGDHRADFNLTSDGVRSLYSILFFDRTLLDGQPTLNQSALGEVAELFDAKVVLDSTTIATNPAPIVLPPLTVPPTAAPLAKSQIRSFSPASGTVSLYSRSGFAVNTPVVIARDDKVVYSTRIIAIPASAPNDVQLEVAYSIVPGDYLIYGNINQPGQATVRFPYTPVDSAAIEDINPGLNRLKVASTLSFSRSRAFVTSQTYEDIAEVSIINKDDQQGFLFVDNIQGLAVGHIISQAEDEQLIDSSCYDAYLLQEVEGVEIAEKYTNGVKVINKNNVPVQVQVAILPSTY